MCLKLKTNKKNLRGNRLCLCACVFVCVMDQRQCSSDEEDGPNRSLCKQKIHPSETLKMLKAEFQKNKQTKKNLSPQIFSTGLAVVASLATPKS